MFREGNLVVHNKKLKRVNWVSHEKSSIEVKCLKTGNYNDFHKDRFYLVKHVRIMRVTKPIPTLLLLLSVIIAGFISTYSITDSVSLGLLTVLAIFYTGITKRWFFYQSYSY